MASVQILEGFRKSSKIYYTGDGNYYYSNRLFGGKIALRCILYRSCGCKGTAVTSEDLQTFQEKQPHINHGKKKSLLEVRQLRTNILKKCSFGNRKKFRDIVRDESTGSSRKARALNTVIRLRSSMRRALLRSLPNVPSSLSELHHMLISAEHRNLSKALDGSGSLYAGGCGSSANRTRSLIFMSQKMKRVMRKAKVIFSDGTWDGRPAEPKSSQIFSISTTWQHHILPICIVIMESKTQNAYVKLFNAIKTLVPGFNPTRINCDFEIAQYNAWQVVFGARVVGCLYHYAVNVSKYARSLGFTNQIANNPLFSSIIRSCLAIPLLPDHLLEDGLKSVMLRAERDKIYCDGLDNFFSYLYEEWISKRRAVLSVFNSSDRTSNVAESWNAKMQSAMGVKSPNIFNFLYTLLLLEDEMKQNMYCLARGIPVSRPRKVSALKNDAAIKLLTSLCLSGHISINRFLRRASYRLMSPYRQIFPELDDDDDNL